jgi:predicted transcriptional regulator
MAKSTDAEDSLKKRTHVRLGDELTGQLQAMADSRQMSLSALVRTAVEMYLQREQFAVALGELEERIAGGLIQSRKETAKVADDVQMLIALFDQLTKFLMFSTPEVIDKEGLGALGNRRYNAFVAELHTAFYVRKKKAKLVLDLENMSAGEGGNG